MTETCPSTETASPVFRLRRLAARESGYTLVELVIVMVVLGVIMSALTAIFVSGSNAELDLNRRFQAQQQARLALDRIRVDIHCASAAQAQTIGAYPGLKLAVGDCTADASTPIVSWCVVGASTSPPRYQLYRSTATSDICTANDPTRVLVADHLTASSNVFTTPVIPDLSLQTVGVDFRVSVNPTTTPDQYELSDVIVARNSPRCTTSGGCSPPAVG